MGSITNEFTCVEFQIVMDYSQGYYKAAEQVEKRFDVIKVALEACEFAECFNLVAGNNGNMYFTAAPCGSKDGWGPKKHYDYEVGLICSLIESVSDFYIIKKVITSEG